MIRPVTECIRLSASGDEQARSELWEWAMPRMREIAGRAVGRWHGKAPLTPTDLVQEVFLKIDGAESLDIESRAHFFALSAVIMRNTLVSAARKLAAEQGAAQNKWQQSITVTGDDPTVTVVDLIGLDEALTELEVINERAVRVVEMKFFGGLTVQQIAEALGMSTRTVNLDWALARQWLDDRLGH